MNLVSTIKDLTDQMNRTTSSIKLLDLAERRENLLMILLDTLNPDDFEETEI